MDSNLPDLPDDEHEDRPELHREVTHDLEIRGEVHYSPLPRPDILAEYKAVDPEIVSWLRQQYEAVRTHRQDLERRQQEWEHKLEESDQRHHHSIESRREAFAQRQFAIGRITASVFQMSTLLSALVFAAFGQSAIIWGTAGVVFLASTAWRIFSENLSTRSEKSRTNGSDSELSPE